MRNKIQGSILIISHQERILNIADQIVLIADGQIVKQGPKEEVMPSVVSDSYSVCGKLQQSI